MCPLTGNEGERRRQPAPIAPCIIRRPRSRANAFQLRPLVTQSPLGPHHVGTGTLVKGSRQSLGMATRPSTKQAVPRLPSLGRCASLAKERTARSMPTTVFLAVSPFTVLCTRTWDTSTCITRCAPGKAATSGRTTGMRAARLSTVSRTRNRVS